MSSIDFDLEEARFRAFYAHNLPLLENALASLIALVSTDVAALASVDVTKIEGRIKDVDECVRKFARKYRTALEENNTPYEIWPCITDLIGLRVVCLYEDELQRIAQSVQSHFEVIEITDKVRSVEATEDAFGYKGLHMDLRLNAAQRDLPQHALVAPFTFELQIRTIIQDSWSVLDHRIKYKKSIPGPLKRRISVLAALFELADREFRQIRDETEAALLQAPDAPEEEEVEGAEAIVQSPESNPGSTLNAFTFLKIATHFFKEFEFEPHKVDLFVADINAWSPGISRARFNTVLRQNIGIIKRYKQYIEEQNPMGSFNPYTVIRHCLYLGDKVVYAPALRKAAREAFDAWLDGNK